MRKSNSVYIASYRRAGRLVPRRAAGLRAGVVVLKPGGVIDWHSTRTREELLIALEGRCEVDIQRPRGTQRTIRLQHSQCLLLPSQTLHRVVNESTKPVRYLYITAPAR